MQKNCNVRDLATLNHLVNHLSDSIWEKLHGITQHVASTTTAWVLRRTGGFKGGEGAMPPPKMPSTAKSRQLLGDFAPGPPELAPSKFIFWIRPCYDGKTQYAAGQPAYVTYVSAPMSDTLVANLCGKSTSQKGQESIMGILLYKKIPN